MLTIVDYLKDKRIILASSSPRRREILSTTFPTLKFDIIPSKFEENLSVKMKPNLFVMETATKKGEEVADRLSSENIDLIISCDTIVAFEDEILGKPHVPENAKLMLKKLSGNSHSVFSGVCLILPKKKGKVQFFVETKVFFDVLSEEMIEKYVETKEPLDKAGGYGIQAIGGCLVNKIEGDYFNVVGFPLNRFCNEMFKLKNKNLL